MAATENPEAKRLSRFYGLTGASILLMFASFHPIDWGLLAWFAVVPLLYCTTAIKKLRHIFLYAGAVGFLYHLIGLSWLALTSPEAWLATVFFEGLYMGASVGLTAWIQRRSRLPYGLVLPFVWTAFDFERARFKFFAFPWLLLSQTQHDNEVLVQIVDVVGIYGVGFLVLMANGLLLDTLLRSKDLVGAFSLTRPRGEGEAEDPEDPQRPVARTLLLRSWGAFAALLLISLLYGFIRRAQVADQVVDGPKILCIQTDVPSRVDVFPDPKRVKDRYLDLTELSVRKHGDFDVIVAPETMWYQPLDKDYLDYQRWVKSAPAAQLKTEPRQRKLRAQQTLFHDKRLRAIPQNAGADMILGCIDYRIEDGRLTRRHNSAFRLSKKDGAVVDRFDKVWLVPASEYVPGKDTLLFDWFFRFVTGLVPEGFSVFDPGEGPKIFEVEGHKLAPNICFDVSFGHFVRAATLAGADVHVNLSNYSWFRSSQALELALVQGKLRAIESRRGVVKCVNAGPSVSFDPLGRVTNEGRDLLPHYSERELRGPKGQGNNEGALLARTRTSKLMSFYVRFGDVFAWFAVLGALALAIAGRRLRRLTEVS